MFPHFTGYVKLANKKWSVVQWLGLAPFGPGDLGSKLKNWVYTNNTSLWSSSVDCDYSDSDRKEL